MEQGEGGTTWLNSREPTTVDLWLFVLAVPALLVAMALWAVVPAPSGHLAFVAFAFVAVAFHRRANALYRGATGEEHPAFYKPADWATWGSGLRDVCVYLDKPRGPYGRFRLLALLVGIVACAVAAVATAATH